MKDEEMAEKKYCKGCKWRIEQCLWAWRNTNGLNEPNEKNCSCKEVPAFLAGLKAGRPQWHDLRKDENDLPKEPNEKMKVNETWAYVKFFDNTYGLVDKRALINYKGAIAWCELPTFDKE